MTRNEWIISSVIIVAFSILPIFVAFAFIPLALDPRPGIAAVAIPGLHSALAIFTILGLIAIIVSFHIKNRILKKAIVIGGLASAFISVGTILLPISITLLKEAPFLFIALLTVIGLSAYILFLYHRHN